MKYKGLFIITFLLPILFSFLTKEKNLVTLKTGWYYITEDRSGTSRVMENSTEHYLIDTIPILTARDIQKVELIKGYNGFYMLKMKCTESKIEIWRSATAKSIQKKLAFILNDKLIYAPIVQSEIPNGVSAIAGNFSKEELLAIKKLIEKESKSGDK